MAEKSEYHWLPSKLWSNASLRLSSATRGALLCLTSGFFRLQMISVLLLLLTLCRLGRFMDPKLALLSTAFLLRLLVRLPMVVLIEISCLINLTSWFLISICQKLQIESSSASLHNYSQIKNNDWKKYFDKYLPSLIWAWTEHALLCQWMSLVPF